MERKQCAAAVEQIRRRWAHFFDVSANKKKRGSLQSFREWRNVFPYWRYQTGKSHDCRFLAWSTIENIRCCFQLEEKLTLLVFNEKVSLPINRSKDENLMKNIEEYNRNFANMIKLNFCFKNFKTLTLNYLYLKKLKFSEYVNKIEKL